jgi:hypothetical protein
MIELTLERRSQVDRTPNIGGGRILMTPPISEDYWSYRVLLTDKQAVVGFPKFGTIGVGFAVEDDDWNTNLPFTSSAEEIFDHIKRNKGNDAIPDEYVLAAIRMIQEAIREDREARRG